MRYACLHDTIIVCWLWCLPYFSWVLDLIPNPVSMGDQIQEDHSLVYKRTSPEFDSPVTTTFTRYAFIPTLVAWANLKPTLTITISLFSTLDKSYLSLSHPPSPVVFMAYMFLLVLMATSSHETLYILSVLTRRFFFRCRVSFHMFVLCNLLGYMRKHYHTSLSSCMHTVTASMNTLFGRFNARRYPYRCRIQGVWILRQFSIVLPERALKFYITPSKLFLLQLEPKGGKTCQESRHPVCGLELGNMWSQSIDNVP